LAEPSTRRLRTGRSAGELLRALEAATELDTSTLVCLAGRWLDGTVLIGWRPVRELVDELPPAAGSSPLGSPADGLRFGGGWIGWLDYTGGCWFGYFDTVLCGDRTGWWLESAGSDAGALGRLAATIDALPVPPTAPVRIEALAGTDRLAHLAAVEHTITGIRAGQLYQANICARLTGRLHGGPVDLFEAGLTGLAPDYAAFVRTPRRTVVSMSPELFLDRRGRQLSTEPIKGTRRRTVAGGRLDDPAALELLHSDKDRAENVMIVDLMRNDLARVCRAGTVRPEHLLRIRPAPGVWHLVSRVRGELQPDVGDAELLAASFPPGSVTGAPKLRALRLIGELEQQPRGLFTGALGYLGAVTDRSELSVAIRTFEITGDQLQLGVGGGITADSVPMQEWHECLVKAAPLLALGGEAGPVDPVGPPEQVDPAAGVFETMLALGDHIVALADHLARIEASCSQLYHLRLPAGLADRLRAAVAGCSGRRRLRLTICPDGRPPLIEVAPLGEPAGPLALKHLGWRGNGSWRHKWADRSWLAGTESDTGLPLFTDADGAVAETSRGNLAVVARPGLLRTPALTDDVLPGITRRRLLDAAFDHGWLVEFGPVAVAELHRGRLTVQLSSISGVRPVDRLDGRPLAVDAGLLDELRGWLG
jgi:para-aminobenzoate synthetase/4-amino-4-deoxychorismate lyase